MKTPKEKAIELIKEFNLPFSVHLSEAKQCALITVRMISKCCAYYDYNLKKEFENPSDLPDDMFSLYREEVEKEIINYKE